MHFSGPEFQRNVAGKVGRHDNRRQSKILGAKSPESKKLHRSLACSKMEVPRVQVLHGSAKTNTGMASNVS